MECTIRNQIHLHMTLDRLDRNPRWFVRYVNGMGNRMGIKLQNPDLDWFKGTIPIAIKISSI